MKVPDKLSMLAFVRLVRSYVDDKKGYPIIVHCRYDVKLNSCIFSEQHLVMDCLRTLQPGQTGVRFQFQLRFYESSATSGSASSENCFSVLPTKSDLTGSGRPSNGKVRDVKDVFLLLFENKTFFSEICQVGGDTIHCRCMTAYIY